MSLYSQRLEVLKKEIKEIKIKQKKKKFKPNQQIMIDFINGVTTNAKFKINGKNIILYKGDLNKGFVHILTSHYCSGCLGELCARDILNIDIVLQKGIKLNKIGISNNNLIVYRYLKGVDEYKLVLKHINNNTDFIVTYYSKKVGR
ncbi:MAG: hypothetical protein ACOX39_09260 [Arcobacteraceae bacterium]|nr:hypothetical protein [Arcobacteraceae bacterium]